MALRSPIYLDTETLLSQAEYYGLKIPQQAEIVEKSVRRQAGGGKAGVGAFGLEASKGTDVEFQSTYSLQPKQKATFSKLIDALINDADAVKVDPDGETPLVRDDLVQIEGTTRITAASLAGKMFFILRRLMDTVDANLESLRNLDLEDLPFAEQLQQVYLQNELLPIPILLELTGSNLPQKVYVNVPPDHFLGEASANRIEGELRVLGSISRLIPGGGDGYLSAEQWLLHDWEHMMRRFMMLDVDDHVRQLVSHFDLDLPAEDVHSHIAGPAIIVDAIGLY
ncbi:hypothetical protein OG939_35675 [Streptomyces sp. NBC_01685]|uniref:DUF6414 family protein n=1 Tax=Streptomyces sp. NBC_01685 TaxID=2975910 RepID=UPI002E33EDD6|nr:hypothetical protein [Streptomyces sp. NBC_01685]